MTTPSRDQVLNANRAIRDGNHQKPRRLDEGFVEMRIPEDDWPVLCAMYGLDATEHHELEANWKRFRNSPIAEQYMVVDAPATVQRKIRHGNKGIIVR